MAPEFHQRVRQIFDQALERSEADRPAFVQTASGGDAALSEAVERLLRARRESESFLDVTLGNAGQIGRYLVRGELGRGAMGIVYDAVDPMIGRRVAVKVISLQPAMDPSEAEFMKERLFREARSAGRLFHPGIVIILDVGLHENSAYITMEHVDGPSLHQLLATGPLDHNAAFKILQQTAAALDYAHQQGVVHRDIKPANIMLQNKVTVKVADFGIAKLMSTENATVTGMLMGTPSYMSPEQIEAKAVDGRSDQFALAVLAYELLTGSRPFQADSMPTVAHLIVYGPRPSAHARNSALPPGIDHVLERAWNRFPDQRFPNCMEFTTALEAAFRNPVAAPAPALGPSFDPSLQQKRWPAPVLYAGGIALVIVMLALASLYYRNSYSRPVPAAASSAPAVVQPAVPAKPTPLGLPQPAPAIEKPATLKAEQPSAPAASTAPPLDLTPDPKQKPLPASFRAQEYYNAAMLKRREGKPEDAIDLFSKSAALGDANAMEELAESYSNGEGVAKNDAEAVEWFTLAAKAGNSSAMLTLGGLYLLGNDGVEQNDEDAAKWFQKAADLKNAAAIYDLGKLYEDGQGVPRNMEKAKELYLESAKLGNAFAQRRLSELQGK
ncbi:MAG: protein kinase [Bryobacteraceae bacterium]|jgi:serine/threonine protein kinase